MRKLVELVLGEDRELYLLVPNLSTGKWKSVKVKAKKVGERVVNAIRTHPRIDTESDLKQPCAFAGLVVPEGANAYEHIGIRCVKEEYQRYHFSFQFYRIDKDLVDKVYKVQDNQWNCNGKRGLVEDHKGIIHQFIQYPNN